MIDWLTVRVPGVDLEVCAGRILSVDRDGCIEWQALKRVEVRGSHDATVTLRTVTHAHKGDFAPGALEVSGNPAKWFQGHNVFGSDDLVRLVDVFVRSVCEVAGVDLPERAQLRLAVGDVVLTRVDVTQSWDLGNTKRAVSAVRAVSEFGHLHHRGRGSLTKEGTVYFGKGSRRASAKLYAKGLELQKHTLPAALPARPEVEAFAGGLLRAEFTLRGMWLRDRRLEVPQNWETIGATPETVHAELMAGLNLSQATIRDQAELDALPPRIRLTYRAWVEGDDLRAMLPARTFYRYRRELLKHGVDIAVRRPGRNDSNVVPLGVVLVGRPVSVPEWAKGTPLYFEPRAA